MQTTITEVPSGHATRAVSASVSSRYLAKTIDLAVVFGPAYMITLIDTGTGGWVIIFGWLIYNWLMVAVWGATLGKLIVGVVIVDMQDKRCHWVLALGRVLLEYTYLLPIILVISAIALAVSKESRSPLDRTIGTKVVRRASVRHLFMHAVSEPETALEGAHTVHSDFEQQLRKLAQLRDDGIITDMDFERKKKEILSL